MKKIIPLRTQIIFYTMGKTWQAANFRLMRDTYGFNINSRWIDSPQALKDENDVHPEHVHKDEVFKRELWDYGCKEDCISCHAGFLYCEPRDGNMLSGALVELGHITGPSKPVYIVGTCESIEPVGYSDRAWKSQACVHVLPTHDILEGMNKAITHYQKNYWIQWATREFYQDSDNFKKQYIH